MAVDTTLPARAPAGNPVRRMAATGLQRLAAPFMASRPVAAWPAWAGDLYEMKIPANVRPQAPSPRGGSNINIILDILERTAEVRGDVAECGVFRGASLLTIGMVLRQQGCGKRAFGFDSFEGFGPDMAFDLQLGGEADAEKRHGGFDGTSLGYVRARVQALGLDGVVTLVQGYFDQTLPRQPDRAYSFVHLDCDIYGSYKTCLDYFYPRLSPGGVILLDEYNDPPWPGCNQAVDEFTARHGLSVNKAERDGFQKYYIVKQG